MTAVMTGKRSMSFGEWLRHVWHEGLVRHVVIKKGEARPVDLPLTVVIVGGVLAPWLLAIGFVVAIIKGYSLETERRDEPSPAPPAAPPLEGPVEATGEPPPEG